MAVLTTDLTLTQETALRAKRESTYGTDSAPTIEDNLVRVLTGMTVNRLEGNRTPDNRHDPFFGGRGEFKGNHYAGLKFSCYDALVDAGQTDPLIGHLLEACGFSSTVVAGTSNTYSPVQSGVGSSTFWLDQQGELHKFIGARGGFVVGGKLGEPVKFDFDFKALIGGDPINENFPAAVEAIDDCVPVMTADTTACTWGGVALDIDSFSLSVENDVRFISTTSGDQIAIIQRKVTGTMNVLTPDLTTFDYRAKEQDPCLKETLVIDSGTVTVSSDGASMGITSPTDINGMAGITIPFTLKRTDGNDDVSLLWAVPA